VEVTCCAMAPVPNKPPAKMEVANISWNKEFSK
jgi:hypothetical protein